MNILLFIIGAIPFLRRRYLETVRWQLTDDQSEIIFNKAVPMNPYCLVFGRTVINGKTASMTVYLWGQLIAREGAEYEAVP